MKTLLFAISILFALNSCTSYHYSTLNSNNSLVEKSENGDFIVENDTVKIIYRFNGENAPIQISVFNKTSQPIYVDWSKSSLIVDDVATSYQGNRMKTQGTTSSSGFNYNRTYSESNGEFSATTTLPKGLSFIPPRSKIENTSLQFTNIPLDRIPKENYSNEYLVKKDDRMHKVKGVSFTAENSPLAFRSYLTLYIGDKLETAKSFALEQDFYVSKVFKTGSSSPSSFPNDFSSRGDLFYTTKEKGTGAATIGLLLIGSAAILATSGQAQTN